MVFVVNPFFFFDCVSIDELAEMYGGGDDAIQVMALTSPHTIS